MDFTKTDASAAELRELLELDFVRHSNSFHARLEVIRSQGLRYVDQLKVDEEKYAVAVDNQVAYFNNELVGTYDPDALEHCRKAWDQSKRLVHAFRDVEPLLLSLDAQTHFEQRCKFEHMYPRDASHGNSLVDGRTSSLKECAQCLCEIQIFLDSPYVGSSRTAVRNSIRANCPAAFMMLMSDPHIEICLFEDDLLMAVLHESFRIVTEMLRISQTPQGSKLWTPEKIDYAFARSCDTSNSKCFDAFVEFDSVFQALSPDAVAKGLLRLVDQDSTERIVKIVQTYSFFQRPEALPVLKNIMPHVTAKILLARDSAFAQAFVHLLKSHEAFQDLLYHFCSFL